MVTRVPAERHVLEWARKACGLTIEAAAELLGCKPSYLRAIEEGKQLPSATIFRNMASRYGFPEATLLAGEPPVLPAPPRDHRTFDGIPPLLTYATLMAIRGVHSRQESLQELAEIGGAVERPALRVYRKEAENPETVALQERKQFGLSVRQQLETSADKMWMTYRMRIEAMGVSVYVEDFPLEDCRGISLFVGEFPAIILSRNEIRAQWKLFSLMHEYCHILIRDPGISDERRNTRDSTEAFCNKFAAAFLMPEAAIQLVLPVSREMPQEFNVATLDEAASALKVSISALALRLEDLGFAPPGFFNRIRSVLKPPAPRRTSSVGPIPREYIVLNNLGYRFTSDVLRCVDSGAISRVEASRILQTNPSHWRIIAATIANRRREYLQHGAV